MFGRLGPYADYLVVNVSSPNTPDLRQLQNRESLRELVQHCQAARDAVHTESWVTAAAAFSETHSTALPVPYPRLDDDTKNHLDGKGNFKIGERGSHLNSHHRNKRIPLLIKVRQCLLIEIETTWFANN